MSTFRDFGTPEELLSVAGDLPPGYPIDAIDCALGRAEALLALLLSQFDCAGAGRLADKIICNALWAVSGDLTILRKLIDYGYATESQRVAEELARALESKGGEQ